MFALTLETVMLILTILNTAETFVVVFITEFWVTLSIFIYRLSTAIGNNVNFPP